MLSEKESDNEHASAGIRRDVSWDHSHPLAKEKSGTYGWSWDFIFIPDGYNKTMGNYPDEERCHVWNTDAYTELADYLKNKED